MKVRKNLGTSIFLRLKLAGDKPPLVVANKPAFPKERLRGRTVFRKALPGRPKTNAAIFPRAFEISFTRKLGHRDRYAVPGSEAQKHMNIGRSSFPQLMP